jgi:hypothetical protein
MTVTNSTKIVPWDKVNLPTEYSENHSELISNLKLPNDFFFSLANLTDLQFVMTISVIVEGSVAEALRRKLDNQVLAEWILKNTMHSKRLNLLEELGVIGTEEKKVFVKVSEIRNQYAHQVENLGKSLLDFYKNLSEGKKKEILDAFCPFLLAKNQIKVGPYDDAEVAKDFRGFILSALTVPLYSVSAFLSKNR